MFRRITLATCLIVVVLLPATARAQWYTSGYLGANHTHTADITIDQASEGTSLRFEDVTFAGRPLASPQYYGIRIGRLFGERRRLGVEVEFIHLKVIANTERAVHTTGTLNGAALDTTMPMDAIVQQYAMTHGLNFLVFNLVSKRPLGERAAFVTRIGAGPTIPHAETTIQSVNREQYEYAGPGIHGSAGLEFSLKKWFSVFAEYKLTAARPEISVAAGTGRTTSVSHQVATGFTFGSTR